MKVIDKVTEKFVAEKVKDLISFQDIEENKLKSHSKEVKEEYLQKLPSPEDQLYNQELEDKRSKAFKHKIE